MDAQFNASRILVGFWDWHNLDDYKKKKFASPEGMAHATLSKLRSFRSIILKFNFLNAVLVSVDPAQSEQFAMEARRLDEVEYCDHDYHLQTCSFTSSLNSAHTKGIDQDIGLAPHRSIYGNVPYAYGASIALLDTGLAPHPFLPALSFRQATETPLMRHPDVRGDVVERFLRHLQVLESRVPNVYNDAKEHRKFATRVNTELAQFDRLQWKTWETELQGWISQQAGRVRAPPIPRVRSIFGALRVVSPQSWNFVDDNPNIFDCDGHGTAMAGCISGLSPLSHGILPEISPALQTSSILPSYFRMSCIEHLDFNLSGIAPYSELIVLKCMEASKSEDSTLSTIIKALGYCLQIAPDCIYFGMALRHLKQAPVMSLSRMTAQIEKRGIAMFAPAGNEGTAGLHAPAASVGVLPVTAIAWDANQTSYARADYSSYADVQNQESVEYCACGGTEAAPFQVLSPDYGFAYDYGTSISAAVVAGIYANEIATLYANATENIFRNQVAMRSQITPQAIRSDVDSWSLGPPELKLIKASMRTKVVPPPISLQSNGPHAEFGYGQPRI